MSEETVTATQSDPLDLQQRVAVAIANHERVLIRLVTTIARICKMYASRGSVSHFGISITQTIVLGELFNHNGCRQEDMRSYVALDKGNVTRALQRLEEYGLVQRMQDPHDRRVVRVYVTEKALSIEREMFVLAKKWDDIMTAGFTPEERDAVITLLVRMEGNVRALAKEDGVLPDDM